MANGIPKESRSLRNFRLFAGLRSRYAWIAEKAGLDNAGLLSVYITNVLSDMIGAKRPKWAMSDWDLAEHKLDEIEEFVAKVLEGFADP